MESAAAMARAIPALVVAGVGALPRALAQESVAARSRRAGRERCAGELDMRRIGSGLGTPEVVRRREPWPVCGAHERPGPDAKGGGLVVRPPPFDQPSLGR